MDLSEQGKSIKQRKEKKKRFFLFKGVLLPAPLRVFDCSANEVISFKFSKFFFYRNLLLYFV